MTKKTDSWLTRTSRPEKPTRRKGFRLGALVFHSRWGYGHIERLLGHLEACVKFNRTGDVRVIRRTQVKCFKP